MTRDKRCIGVVHFAPLPGSPRYDKGAGLDIIIQQATADLEAYVAGGIDGVIFENYGDAPFYPSHVPPVTVAAMTRIISDAVDNCPCPAGMEIGVNVLRNDAKAALSIASAVGGTFVRVNVLSGVYATDQGIIEGIAHELLRFRQQIGASDVKIMADVHVKHATPLMERDMEQEAEELVSRCLVDGGLVFTGPMTGKAPARDLLEQLPAIKKKFPDIPLFIGSGAKTENIRQIMDAAESSIDGFIVATSLKGIDGRIKKDLVSRFLSDLGP